MRYALNLSLVLVSLLALAGCSQSPTTGASAETQATLSPVPAEGQTTHGESQVELVSKTYDIDRIYKSMTGPWSDRPVAMLTSSEPELVWITGCHVEMVGPDGHAPMSEQFMCHANLDIDADKHNALFGMSKDQDARLFTLSQGQLNVAFPAGFGIPVMSNEPLSLSTQVLNLNVKDKAFQVRHKVKVDFVRDREAKTPMQPLYECGVSGQVSLAGKALPFGVDEKLGHEKCKSCCIPGRSAGSNDRRFDRYGREFSGHWIVKPGREENHTRITEILNLPFDTRLHYIAVHMHPFAESLELRDMTTDQSLFLSRAENFTDKIGLAHMDAFASVEGLPLYQNHDYELVSVYNNTTTEDQDSMAVMYLYLADNEFKKPAGNAAPQVEQAAANDAR